MRSPAAAEQRLLRLFQNVVVVCVILSLAGWFLWFAAQRQQDATDAALRLRAQLWRERMVVLQQQWRGQQPPNRWVADGMQFSMSAAGWPVATTVAECQHLWQAVLAEPVLPLVQKVEPLAHGCRYLGGRTVLIYDYQLQQIAFSATKQ